jgi:hypothetical protein
MSVNDLNLRILASVETDPCKLNPSEWSHQQSYKRDVVSISLYSTIASIWVPFRHSIDLGIYFLSWMRSKVPRSLNSISVESLLAGVAVGSAMGVRVFCAWRQGRVKKVQDL